MFTHRSFNDGSTARTAYYNYPLAVRIKEVRQKKNDPVMLMIDKLLELKQNEITSFIKNIFYKNDLAMLQAACLHLSFLTECLKAEIKAMESNGTYLAAMTMRLDASLLSDFVQEINNAINEISPDYCGDLQEKRGQPDLPPIKRTVF